MIHSSSVEGHHFLAARRRGYDPAEVDAVIKRLVATLRKYEEQDQQLAASTRELTSQITNLDEVRTARNETLQDAEAATEELHAAAVARLEEARSRAADEVAAAENESARIREAARDDATGLLARRNSRTEALITAALSEVKALRSRVLRETNEFRAGKRTEAAAMVQAAQLDANQILEDARHEAGSILGRARREHAGLEQRIGQLRSAIAGIEGQFRHLAESTLEQTEIVSSMISLETSELDEILERQPAEHEVVRLTQQGPTVDLTDGEASPSRSHSDDHFVVAPGNTIYQRRGGGLRRRLEEDQAERSE